MTVSNLKRFTIGYLLVVVPIVGWSTFKLSHESLLVDYSAEVRGQLDLFSTNVRGEIEKYEFLPRVLANDSAVQRLLRKPDDARQIAVVNQKLVYANRASKASDTYLMNHEGTTIAASNWSSTPTFVGRNFSFRPYFQEAMEGRDGRYFALGTTSGKRGYYFSSPAHGDETGDVIGAVVVKVSMENLERAWYEHNVTLLITGEYGVVFSTNKPDWQFLTLTPLTEAALNKIRDDQQYPLSQLRALSIRTLEENDANDVVRVEDENINGNYLRITQLLPDLGWTVHALAPMSPLQQRVYSRVTGAILVSLMVWTLLFAAALRRISLQEQLALRQRTEEQLIEARDKLEHRVKERTHELTLSNKELQQENAERRRAERDLRIAQDELIHAAKLATLGQLSAGITHELNQPLAAIRAYAENAITLLERGDRPETGGNLKEILKLSDRVSQITAHLKTYARKTDDVIEPVSLKGCIDSALSLVSARLRASNVDLEVALTENGIVSGNAVRLEQVFVNLFTNALDAMKHSSGRRLEVQQHQEGEYLVTQVIDSGPGIELDHMDQIFDPFFTTKRAGVGLGLGLSISHGIVQKLGGRLTVENHCDGGACFNVILSRL